MEWINIRNYTMDNFIFKPSSLFTKKDNIEEITELYTLIGTESFIDEANKARSKEENNTVLAKKIIRKNGSIKYTIRLGNNGKFYNPISIYGQEKTHTFLNRICRSNDKFKEVGQKVFSMYLEFLNTKNISLLINAEREHE
jgi:hypothetical protein